MPAVSTARAWSDVNVTAIPSSWRRAPSSGRPAASERQASDSSPGCHPVASPRSLSIVIECVSKTSVVATAARYAARSGALAAAERRRSPNRYAVPVVLTRRFRRLDDAELGVSVGGDRESRSSLGVVGRCGSVTSGGVVSSMWVSDTIEEL